MIPKYPHVRVAVRSPNPLAAISAIREALRRAGVGRVEIGRFSQQAFACRDAEKLRQVCGDWVRVEAPNWSSLGTDFRPSNDVSA